MEIKIEAVNAEEEIKLLERASSLIDELGSILRQLDTSFAKCKSFCEFYSPDKK